MLLLLLPLFPTAGREKEQKGDYEACTNNFIQLSDLLCQTTVWPKRYRSSLAEELSRRDSFPFVPVNAFIVMQQHWLAVQQLQDWRLPVWLCTSLNTTKSPSQNRKLKMIEEADSLQLPLVLQMWTHQKATLQFLQTRVKTLQFSDTRSSKRKQCIKRSPGASIYFETALRSPDTMILLHTVTFPSFSCR